MPRAQSPRVIATIFRTNEARIAALAVVGIVIHLILRFGLPESVAAVPHFGGPLAPLANWPLLIVLVFGGGPLVVALLRQAFAREFGSDLLAGIAIVTAVLLGEYLAGALVVLMLSGGQALEAYAVKSASSVLEALARRSPSIAHRRRAHE